MPESVLRQQTIIGDSGPLIALAIIGQLELLPKLYRHVVVPYTVWQEITGQGLHLPGAMEISRLTWLEIT
jgi:predicted nucleic acid-binding protein